MPEHGLKLFELDGREIRHVARDHLVLEKDQLFRHGGFDKAELVGELIVGVGCEVVFFNVSFLAFGVEVGKRLEKGVEGGQVGVQALNVGALVVDVTFEAGNGE